MGKDDYDRREAQRKADEAKHHAANEAHRKTMEAKAAFQAKERQKTRDAWERSIKESERTQNSGKPQSKDGPCFIATAAFGDYDAPQVVFLRAFRDQSLSQGLFGRSFIRAYYRLSPPLARAIARSKILCSISRNFILQPAIALIRVFKHP